jgi:hypothetical protein
MALELTPPEPGSRNPRRRVRELSSLLWLCGWGCVTAIALAALAITSQTEIASDQIFATNESSAIARMPSRMTQLESETQILAAQIRTLSIERDRLAGRIALLESTIDDMTGTIKKQAAATAAALAASAPQPSSRSANAPPVPPQSAETNAGVTATPVTTIPITRPANADTPSPQLTPLPRRALRARPQTTPRRNLRTRTNLGWSLAPAPPWRLYANARRRLRPISGRC